MTIMTASCTEVVPFPAAPQSLEETGIPLDLILQLALKSLHFAGELSGTELSPPPRARVSRHPAGARPAQGPAADFDRRRRDRRRRVVSLPDQRCRTSTGGPVSRKQPLRRRRAGPARAVPGLHARPTVPPRLASRRAKVRRAFSHLVISDARARPARAGDQRRAFDVRVRAARKRQDGDLAGDSQPARGRHRHSSCARDRRAASSASSTRSITS